MGVCSETSCWQQLLAAAPREEEEEEIELEVMQMLFATESQSLISIALLETSGRE